MKLPQGYTLENEIKPPPGFELVAPDSNLPPFDITLPVGADSTEVANKIIAGRRDVSTDTAVKPPDGFSLVNTPGGTWGVGDTLRGAGAVLGGFAAMPVAGVAGLSRLITTGSLDEAKKTVQGISSVPSNILITDKQREVADNVGKFLSWPFVTAGKGYAGLAELISTGDLQKAEDVVKGKSVGSNIAVPIADILGQAEAMLAFGEASKLAKEKFAKIKAKVAPEVTPPEGFVLESTKPVDVIPPEGFTLEEKPAGNVTPEQAKIETAPAPIIESGATSQAVAADAGVMGAVEVPTVQPWATSGGKLPTTRVNGPENLITSLEKQGGVNFGESYNLKQLKRDPDFKRISRGSGTPVDEVAANLNAEGVVSLDGQPWTADSLVETIKTGQGRNIFTPAKQDGKIEQKLWREQNVWAEEQVTKLRQEGIDFAGTAASDTSLHADSLAAIKGQGFDIHDEAAVLNELDRIYAEVSAPKQTPKGQFETADIPGMSAAKTFSLANPETNWGTLKDGTVAPTGDMFAKPSAIPPETTTIPTGEGKVAKAANDINKAMVEKGFEELPQDQLAAFDPITKAATTQKITDMMGDTQKSKDMAAGRETFPAGTNGAEKQVLFNAVKKKAFAEGDVGVMMDLASSPLAKERSVAAQTLGASGWDNSLEDPVKVMQDVATARSAKIEKITGKKADPSTVMQAGKAVDLAEQKLTEHETSKAIERIKNDVAQEQRQTKRTYEKRELSVEFSGLVKDLNKILGGQLNVGIDPAAAAVLGKMAMNRVKSGIITVEGLVDSIYTEIKNAGIELSKRDIMDAISGYGKYKQLSKDEILVQLRDLKGQMQQISKLEDLQNRQPPLKTGVERRIPSDEERRLIKQVEEAKRKYGVQGIDPAIHLKSSQDAIKTRLTNQITDLESQIASREKIIKDRTKIAYDAEALSLKAKRDGLKKQYDLIFEGPKKTPEQVALQSLKTRLKNEETKLSDQLKNLDFTKKDRRVIALDPEAEKRKAARDQAKENYNAAANAAGVMTKEEATRIVELSKSMSDKKAEWNPQTKSWSSKKARLDYGAANVAWQRYVDELKGANASIMEQAKGRMGEAARKWKEDKVKASFDLAKDSAKTIADNSVVAAGSYDLSFIGRQGWFTLLTHPTAWISGARKMFFNAAKELGGKNALDAYLADVYSRPRYMTGEYQKAKLTSLKEEVYPTDLLERLPAVGKGISVSKVAFLSAGMEMRLRTYDILAKMQERHGIDMMKGKEAESIGTVINSLTYRGKWGKTGVSPWLKLFWWGPNILKGQWDVLTAHTLGYGLDTTFAKKQAFINLSKIVAEGVAIATIANTLKPGSAETDPTGSEFGTIRIGEGAGQNFDYTGGSRSMIIAVARTVSGRAKNSKTGNITYLDKGDFGKATRLTVPVNFMLNKANPPAGVVRDWLKNEFYGGEKFTWLGAFFRMYTPITAQQSIQLGTGTKPITGPSVGGVVSDVFGVNSPSFNQKPKAGGF